MHTGKNSKIVTFLILCIVDHLCICQCMNVLIIYTVLLSVSYICTKEHHNRKQWEIKDIYSMKVLFSRLLLQMWLHMLVIDILWEKKDRTAKASDQKGLLQKAEKKIFLNSECHPCNKPGVS